MPRACRGGHRQIVGSAAQIQAAGHVQLRRAIHGDRRRDVVRLRRTVLPIVTGIQTASGVQCRPVLHGQCGQHGQVGIVGIGVAPRHADVPGKIHRPRPVQRQRGMHRLRIRVGDIQSAREIGNGRAVADREADVLVALVAHVKAASELHHAAHGLGGQFEVVGSHGIGGERAAGSGGTAAQDQVVGHVDLRANVDV